MTQRPMASYYDRVLQVESNGNPNAVSPKGARGLMQIMPNTGRDPGFGITPLRNNSPEENVRFGRDYLDAMHNRYGDPTAALVAYNAGPAVADDWVRSGRDPNKLPAETRNYVAKVTGTKSMDQGTPPALLIQPQPQRNPVAPTLARNPNAPAEITQRPILTQDMIAGALGPQTAAVEADPAMQQLNAMNGMVDANVAAKQAAVLGNEAVAFAKQNNLPLNDPRVAAFAADKNVGGLQKGLSFLQGIVGLPIGMLRNAALGENNDLTAAFRPERSYATRAQAAIAALDAQGLAAKKEIAEMRQDVRQSIFTAVQPAVSQAYNIYGEQQKANLGGSLDERVINDALRANGFVDQFGNVDRSSPQAQQFILSFTQQMAIAENTGKPDPNAGIAAALTGLTTAFTKSRDDKWGELDAKWQADTLTAADTAAKQIGTAESLLAASRRLGPVNYGGLAGGVKRELQTSLAALGYKSDDLSNAAIVDGLITQQALPRMQMLGGNDSEKELTMITNSLGGSNATAEAREMAQLSNLASLKAQKEYGDIFRSYLGRVGRQNGNQIDFMNSPEYKAFTSKKLFQYEPRILPSLARLAPNRYQNFALVNGQVYVKTGKGAVPISSLSQEQIDKAMGN